MLLRSRLKWGHVTRVMTGCLHTTAEGSADSVS